MGRILHPGFLPDGYGCLCLLACLLACIILFDMCKYLENYFNIIFSACKDRNNLREI